MKNKRDIRIDRLYWAKQVAVIKVNDVETYNYLHILENNSDGNFVDYAVGKRMFPRPIFVERKKLLKQKIIHDCVELSLEALEEMYDRQYVHNMQSVQSFFLD
jgi:hypothetical protein